MRNLSILLCFFLLICIISCNSSLTDDKFLKDVETMIVNNPKKVEKKYTNYILNDKLIDRLRKLQNITFLEWALLIFDNNKIFLTTIILDKTVVYILCNSDDAIKKIYVFKFDEVKGKIDSFTYRSRLKNSINILKNVISVGINDLDKEIIEPIKSWEINFDNFLLKELPYGSIEVIPRGY